MALEEFGRKVDQTMELSARDKRILAEIECESALEDPTWVRRFERLGGLGRGERRVRRTIVIALLLLRPELRDQVIERLATLAPTPVEVVERIPGFCGYRMFRQGDVIVKLLDMPQVDLHNRQLFMTTIHALQAGQALRVSVLRNGEKTDVTIVLDPRPLDRCSRN